MFRYSAGFSADWVRCLVRENREANQNFIILDPFCGVGTTILACIAEHVQSFGFETHPFINRIASSKLNGIQVDVSLLKDIFINFINAFQVYPVLKYDNTPFLIKKCYDPSSLSLLLAARSCFLEKFDLKTPETELLWLAITSILRICSNVGTAQWQYVLPNKVKVDVQTPIVALKSKMSEILHDISYAQREGWSDGSRIILADARAPQLGTQPQVDLVVTSPPYPNNYDYADATRLEMTFWGEINCWGDLHKAVRKHLITSCSQHSAAEKFTLTNLLCDPVLEPIRDELSQACHTLEKVRESKGGRKTYHTMAAAYFRDLGYVFNSLRPLCRRGSLMCFVIGDSAPYGVYLNVEDWLGRLAVAAGFKSYSFEKMRDRNIKWKNRKHQVPLKEGRLWIKG